VLTLGGGSFGWFFAFHALGSFEPHSFSSDLYCREQFLTYLRMFVVLGGLCMGFALKNFGNTCVCCVG
jgi:hypothetical protein